MATHNATKNVKKNSSAKSQQLPHTAATASRNVLYVVLHGLICLIDDNQDHFTAVLADMGDEHEYLCGDFLNEKEIENGSTLTLNGTYDQIPTKSTVNQLDPNLNAVVKLAHMPTIDNYYQSKLILPRPINIYYYIQGTLNTGSLPNPNNELRENPTIISGIRVFKYGFDVSQSVNVMTDNGDIIWDCPPLTTIQSSSGEELNVAVLHIYNEPSDVLSDAAKHNRDEFNFTLAYLGAPLRLTSAAVVPPQNSMPPDGIVKEELVALDMRDEMAPMLMDIIRKQKHTTQPLNEITFLPSKIKQDISYSIFGAGGGGAGGSQVCGGANGLVTG